MKNRRSLSFGSMFGLHQSETQQIWSSSVCSSSIGKTKYWEKLNWLLCDLFFSFFPSVALFAMLWRVHWHCVSCVSYSVTTLKKKFCLDPEWKHAQMHLEEFKKRSAPTTLEPETTKEMKTNVSSTTLKPTTIWVWNPRNDQRSYLLLSCVLNCCRTLIINYDHTEMFLV